MVISGFGLPSALGFRASGLGPCSHGLVVLSRHARALGGDLRNLDNAGTVSILGAVIVGRREARRLDRIGAQAEGRREGRRANVPACWGCRDGGRVGTRGSSKKPETSKEHPRNMLTPCLQQWDDPVTLRRWQGDGGGLGLAG